uniref:Uncharacterized protein n=1 Tax=Glossina pallidipes TaxID=7398 RepID=A0A1B0A1Z7_GLOPL
MICKRNNYVYISDSTFNLKQVIKLLISAPCRRLIAHNNRNNTNSTDNFVAHRYFVRRLTNCNELYLRVSSAHESVVYDWFMTSEKKIVVCSQN